MAWGWLIGGWVTPFTQGYALHPGRRPGL